MREDSRLDKTNGTNNKIVSILSVSTFYISPYSKNDECVFYKGTTVFFVCTSHGIFIDPQQNTIIKRITELAPIFEIEDNRNLHEYRGIKISKSKDGPLTTSQPQLIESILKDVHLIDETLEPKKGYQD